MTQNHPLQTASCNVFHTYSYSYLLLYLFKHLGLNHRHLSGELRVALVLEARADLPVHLGLLVSPVIAAEA